MAVIHHTTLTPNKLELLTGWLPSRPWFRDAGAPSLTRAGGFRLDDPAGEVGIEFMVVNDAATSYLVPLTYRGAPLAGAESALIGTLEHGVLGTRWVYDGCHDPVLVTELVALIEGRSEPQAQSVSNTPDREVSRGHRGGRPIPAPATFTATDDADGTEIALPGGAVLRLHRLPLPVPHPETPSGAAGHVAAPWRAPDGTRVTGLFAVLR